MHECPLLDKIPSAEEAPVKRALGERDVVDRGQNHICGMSHGQTELIYDWSGSTSAAWCWGSRMSGMGVRSGSRFSLSITSGIGSRLWPAGGIYEAFHYCRGLLTASRYTVRLHQSKVELDAFKETEMDRIVHEPVFFFFFFERIPLFFSASVSSSHDLLSSDIMETTAIFIGWWRSSSVRAMPPVQSAAVNNPLGKKCQQPKNDWEVKGEMCMPCYCPSVFHKSNVLPPLSFMHYYLVSCSMDFRGDNHWVSVFQYLAMNSVGHAVNQCGIRKHSNQSLNVVRDYNFH